MNWRIQAQTAISNALAACPHDASPEAKLKAIDAAYPFGIRDFHPYKIWLDERGKVKAGLGLATRSRDLLTALSPLDRAKAKALDLPHSTQEALTR